MIGNSALGTLDDGYGNTLSLDVSPMGNNYYKHGNENIAIGYRTMEEVNDGF